MPVTPPGRASSTLMRVLLLWPGCGRAGQRGRLGVQRAQDHPVAWLRVEVGGLLREDLAARGDGRDLREPGRPHDDQARERALVDPPDRLRQVVLVADPVLEVADR